MSMVLVTDLDDTLWPCHARYLAAAEAFDAAVSADLGIAAGEAAAAFSALDAAWRAHGWHAGSRWLDAMTASYGSLCGQRWRMPSPAVLNELQRLDDTLWAAPEPWPAALAALAALKACGVPVRCFTAGGPAQQGRKIDALRLERGVDLAELTGGVTIVPHKSHEAHAAFAAALRADYPGARLAYVGDSVCYDMLPARAAGYDAVCQVETPRQWPPVDCGSYVADWPTAATFGDAVAVVRRQLGE